MKLKETKQIECDWCGVKESLAHIPQGGLINDYTQKEWLFPEGAFSTFCGFLHYHEHLQLKRRIHGYLSGS